MSVITNAPLEHEGGGGGKPRPRLWKRVAAIVCAAATLLAGGMLTAMSAHAVVIDMGTKPPTPRDPGFMIGSPSGSTYGTSLGVVSYRNTPGGQTVPVYCIEAGVTGVDPDGGGWEDATDNDSRIAGWMSWLSRDDRSDLTQAAIAYMIHEKMDRGAGKWHSTYKNRDLGGAGGYADPYNSNPNHVTLAQVRQKGEELWNNAASTLPTDAQVQLISGDGQKEGDIQLGVKKVDGGWVAGVPWTITTSGPISIQTSGITEGQPTTLHWTATGNGDVSVQIHYLWKSQKQNASGQDLFNPARGDPYNGNTIAFKVKRSIKLTASTVAQNQFDHAGDTREVWDLIKLQGTDADPGQQAHGTITLNWDGNPYDYTVDQKVDKDFTFPLQPEVESPHFTPGDFGWDKWKAGRYWYDVHIPQQTLPDGTILEALETDDRVPEETWVVDAPSITTDVNKRVAGLNEKFYDTAKNTGRVARGSYVTFTAYDAVANLPDTTARKLLEQRVDITDEQADASSEQGSFTIRSNEISADHEGYVYWKATLYNQRGDQLDTHDLGIETETVHVLPVVLTSQVTNERVTFDQWFGDRATVTGIIEPGSYLVFKAYGPTLMDPILPDGTDNPAVTALKPLYETRVDVTDKQAADSHNRPQTFYSKNNDVDGKEYEKSAMVLSKDTTEGGFVYWKATLYGPDGKERATHQLGIPEETVRVEMPTITTQVSDAEVVVGDDFHDTATIRGKVMRGAYVTFTAYKAVAGSDITPPQRQQRQTPG